MQCASVTRHDRVGPSAAPDAPDLRPAVRQRDSGAFTSSDVVQANFAEGWGIKMK